MATADNVITYTGIADALEDIPDSSAFTIEFIYPDSMRKVFPIYLISGKFWPVTEYSYRKHSVQYKDIKIPNIGVNIYYPLGDEISDTISMTFIEDHTRSIEAAVDTWIKHNMIHKATAIPYWNDTLSQTQSVSIRITTFDATRVNPVKKEEFESAA